MWKSENAAPCLLNPQSYSYTQVKYTLPSTKLQNLCAPYMPKDASQSKNKPQKFSGPYKRRIFVYKICLITISNTVSDGATKGLSTPHLTKYTSAFNLS